jgi:hypothetical protein
MCYFNLFNGLITYAPEYVYQESEPTIRVRQAPVASVKLGFLIEASMFIWPLN